MKTNGQHEVIARIAGPGLVLAALLAMVLSSSSTGHAQASTTSPAVPAAAPAKAAPQAQPSARTGQPAASGERRTKGTYEGITVHGHWIIEVRNPDGKLVTRREFENSIQAPGISYLAAILAENNAPSSLSILLNGANALFPPNGNQSQTDLEFYGPGPCGNFPAFNQNQGWLIWGGGTCLISSTKGVLGGTCLQLAQQLGSAPCSTNLAATGPTMITTPNSISGPPQLTLSGSVPATSTSPGNVTDVETVFETCGASSVPGCPFVPAPGQGVNGDGPGAFDVAVGLFTEANLPTPGVPYSPGQTINVTVTISFSSGS